jgi:hypothetical protein
VTWQELGSIGEFVGAIATVVTLIYLTLQIRQNTAQLKEGARASHFHSLDQTVESFSRYRHLVAQAEIAELLERGLDDYGDFGAVDRTRFRAVVEEYFFAYNALLDRSRRGAYVFNSPSKVVLPLGAILLRPGGRAWWADRGAMFPQEFIDEVESQFPELVSTVA